MKQVSVTSGEANSCFFLFQATHYHMPDSIISGQATFIKVLIGVFLRARLLGNPPIYSLHLLRTNSRYNEPTIYNVQSINNIYSPKFLPVNILRLERTYYIKGIANPKT